MQIKNIKVENWILIISFITFLFLLIQILIQTGLSSLIDFDKASNFGKSIGGILAFASILFLYYGMRNQSKIFLVNQFENRFYEQVKYYRENVDSMVYWSPESKKKSIPIIISDRRYFLFLFREILLSIEFITDIITDKRDEDIFKEEISNKDEFDKRGLNRKEVAIINIGYLVVFYGVAKQGRSILKNILKNQINEALADEIIDRLCNIPVKWSNHLSAYKKNGKPPLGAKYNKYFGGHQHRLGHFFRHLYQSVEYIDNVNTNNNLGFDYITKYNYVKKLRAQFSTYEQGILFFNSISYIGKEWEFHTKDFDKHLITKYNLIKNLPNDFIEGIDIKKYYPNVIYEGDKITEERSNLEKNYT